MNQDLKIIKTVFMPGQKKGKKFMVSKRENEVKEKIQQPGEEKRKKNGAVAKVLIPKSMPTELSVLGNTSGETSSTKLRKYRLAESLMRCY